METAGISGGGGIGEFVGGGWRGAVALEEDFAFGDVGVGGCGIRSCGRCRRRRGSLRGRGGGLRGSGKSGEEEGEGEFGREVQGGTP